MNDASTQMEIHTNIDPGCYFLEHNLKQSNSEISRISAVGKFVSNVKEEKDCLFVCLFVSSFVCLFVCLLSFKNSTEDRNE